MTVTVVTRSNFITLLPSILHHIKDADFIAFDTELTGLTMGSSSKYFYYDEVEERYRKLRDSANNFGILQFGLSAWKYKKSGNRFSSTSWSFHLFPTISTLGSSDYRKWTLQLSSIAFLKEHGFDFNRTFLDGISYLSVKEEGDLRTKREARKQNREVHMGQDDKLFLAETLEKVQRWYKEGHEEQLELPPCHSFHRLLLYQEIPKISEIGKHLKISKNGDQLFVKKVTKQEREEAEEEERMEFERSITEMVGFRRILDTLMKEKKPLVGHNCWLDWTHFYQKFLGPLPLYWDDFRKELVENVGSRVCDTKYIATQLLNNKERSYFGESMEREGGKTSLEQLATAIDDPAMWGVKVRVDGGKTKNKAKELFHDAGFDAYCTGKVFVGLATILCEDNSVENKVKELFEESFGFAGKLFMMCSDYEPIGVDLISDRQEKRPDRSNLLVMTDLNMEAGISHINDLLKHELNIANNDFEPYWLDGKTVYIALTGAAKQMDINLSRETIKVGDMNVRLMSFDRWRRQREEFSPPKRLRC